MEHVARHPDDFSMRSWMQWLPWPLTLIAVVECFYPFHYSSTTSNILRFIVTIILLDLTHAAFGFSLLLHPRISEITRAKVPGSENFRGFTLQSIALIATCTVFFAMAYGAFATSPKALALILATSLQLKWMLNTHHATSQTQGISLLMNKWLNTSSEAAARVQTLEKRERSYARLTVIGMQLSRLSLIAGRIAPEYRVVGLDYFFLGAAAIGVAGWLHTSMSYPNIRAKKTMFVSRMLLTLLTFFSISARMSHKIVHAFEDLFIYRKMLKNGGEAVKTKRFILWSTFFIAAVIVMAVIRQTGGMRELFPGWASPVGRMMMPNYKWVCWVAGLSEALTIYHYFMEGKLFRLREPAVRNAMSTFLEIPTKGASLIHIAPGETAELPSSASA